MAKTHLRKGKLVKEGEPEKRKSICQTYGGKSRKGFI